MAAMTQMDHYLGRSVRTLTNYLFLGQPGIGKTFNRTKFALAMQKEDPNFLYIPFDGGTLSPTDTVMANVSDGTIERLVDRTLIAACQEGAYGVIDIGEWMLMPMEVSKGFQKMLNHEYFALGKRISPGVVFWGDGNRLKDRSGAQQGSRAIGSRWTTINMELDTDYAIEAIKHNYHPHIGSFLIRNPTFIDNYAEVFENDKLEVNCAMMIEGKAGIWANLRSWAKVSAWLDDMDKTGHAVYPEEIQCAVGSSVASTFEVHRSMLSKLAAIEDILANPKKAEVPTAMAECWAMLIMLGMRVNKDSWKAISIYMRRFIHEHQVAYFRLMNDRLAKLNDGNSTAIRNSEEYKDWIVQPYITKLLQGAS